jgi:hypothetical protein
LITDRSQVCVVGELEGAELDRFFAAHDIDEEAYRLVHVRHRDAEVLGALHAGHGGVGAERKGQRERCADQGVSKSHAVS